MDIQNIVLPDSDKFKKRKQTVERILTAASKIMNKNGFANSSMKEIAAAAEVTEPTLYQHFNGKEDLLFSIVEWQVEDSLLYLHEQFQGISGAHNILRKLIWAYLRYNDIQRDYINLVLLECRRNQNFYKSDAYRFFRRYSKIILSILHEGIQEGVFRKDLDPPLIRDMILGVLDFEAYTVIVSGEIKEASPDHEAIMLLLDRILLKDKDEGKSKLKKRQAIIQAAVHLFAKKGYNGATISEIAGRAGVSDGTVYEYFKNKEDLLLSIPEDRFERHLEQLDETFCIRNKSRRLRRFIRDHFRLYLDDHNFLIVYLQLIQLNRRFRKSRAFKSIRRYSDAFENLVREGIDDGSFVKDCNVRVFRNLFFGAFTHMSLRWFVVAQKERVDKFKEISQLTNYLLRAIEIIQ